MGKLDQDVYYVRVKLNVSNMQYISSEKIVELIFEQYANTSMLADGVAKWLNLSGKIKTPPNVLKDTGTRKTEFLKEFSRDQIVRILDNEVYMGKLSYGKRKNYAVKGNVV